jgi:hypothetical protein
MHAYLAVMLWIALSGGAPQADGQQTKSPALKPDPAWTSLGPSLWFDPKAKRLIIKAKVVLREGYLEHLMCSKGTKEHEAILATDAIPKMIQAGLVLTEAEPGHPVRFVPKFAPPTGAAIAIELSWRQDDAIQKADARQWVRDEKAKAPLAIDWVFAGSQFYTDPETKKERYAADDGDLITVANFGSSILDLPIVSSADDGDRVFTANTEKVPPVGTEVWMSLSPRKPPQNTKSRAGAAPSR